MADGKGGDGVDEPAEKHNRGNGESDPAVDLRVEDSQVQGQDAELWDGNGEDVDELLEDLKLQRGNNRLLAQRYRVAATSAIPPHQHCMRSASTRRSQ